MGVHVMQEPLSLPLRCRPGPDQTRLIASRLPLQGRATLPLEKVSFASNPFRLIPHVSCHLDDASTPDVESGRKRKRTSQSTGGEWEQERQTLMDEIEDRDKKWLALANKQAQWMDRIEALQRGVEEKEVQCEELEREITLLKRNEAESAEMSAERIKDLEEELERKTTKWSKQKEHLEEDRRLDEERWSVDEERLKQDLQEMERKWEEATTKSEEHQEAILGFQRERETLQNKIVEVEKELSQTQKEKAMLTEEISQIRKQWEDQFQNTAQEIEVLKKADHVWADKVEKMRVQFEEKEWQIEELQTHIENGRREREMMIVEWESEKATLLRDNQQSNDRLDRKRKKLKVVTEELQIEREAALKRKADVEAERASLAQEMENARIQWQQEKEQMQKEIETLIAARNQQQEAGEASQDTLLTQASGAPMLLEDEHPHALATATRDAISGFTNDWEEITRKRNEEQLRVEGMLTAMGQLLARLERATHGSIDAQQQNQHVLQQSIQHFEIEAEHPPKNKNEEMEHLQEKKRPIMMAPREETNENLQQLEASSTTTAKKLQLVEPSSIETRLHHHHQMHPAAAVITVVGHPQMEVEVPPAKTILGDITNSSPRCNRRQQQHHQLGAGAGLSPARTLAARRKRSPRRKGGAHSGPATEL